MIAGAKGAGIAIFSSMIRRINEQDAFPITAMKPEQL
jgi:hypothetical protein